MGIVYGIGFTTLVPHLENPKVSHLKCQSDGNFAVGSEATLKTEWLWMRVESQNWQVDLWFPGCVIYYIYSLLYSDIPILNWCYPYLSHKWGVLLGTPSALTKIFVNSVRGIADVSTKPPQQKYHQDTKTSWLVVWNIWIIFPFSWEWNNHPNWRAPSFFRGVGLYHQPASSDSLIQLQLLLTEERMSKARMLRCAFRCQTECQTRKPRLVWKWSTPKFPPGLRKFMIIFRMKFSGYTPCSDTMNWENWDDCALRLQPIDFSQPVDWFHTFLVADFDQRNWAIIA